MRFRAVPVSLFVLALLAIPALAGDGSPKVKDKSKPVRHELEQAYAALESALEKNDADAILAFRHPEFRGEDCQGRAVSAEGDRVGTRNTVARTQPPIDAGFELGTIDLNGEDEAVVTVRKSVSGMHKMDGTLRKVDTVQTQDDTWVKTAEGWRLRSSARVRDFAWFVDGKRVEKGKPYDPAAPPFEPEDR